MELINRTPFQSIIFVDVDHRGSQTLVLVIKATYDLAGDAPPVRSAQQRSLTFADMFNGEPGASSLLYEADSNWGREGTDVAFVGYAYPMRERDREVQAMLRVGPLVKSAHVFGDRRWTSRLGLPQLSGPDPFDRVPLVYERAFGGCDDTVPREDASRAEVRNPVGRGWRARRSSKTANEITPPNIENPRQLIRSIDDRPAPAGFGFVAKAWQPRCSFAGTYNDAWQSDRMPLLPADFDRRFYRASSEGLFAQPCLSGGEEVEMVGLSSARWQRFALPRVGFHATFGIDAEVTLIEMNLDSLLIDGAHSKLVLAWHGNASIDQRLDEIEWVLADLEPH